MARAAKIGEFRVSIVDSKERETAVGKLYRAVDENREAILTTAEARALIGFIPIPLEDD